MKRSKLEKIFMDCMRELYSNSEHISGIKGDFDKLLEDAQINERGEKVIPFLEYYIDEDIYSKITDKYFGENVKGLNRYYRNMLSIGIHLGASPTCCKESWEELKKDLVVK